MRWLVLLSLLSGCWNFSNLGKHYDAGVDASVPDLGEVADGAADAGPSDLSVPFCAADAASACESEFVTTYAGAFGSCSDVDSTVLTSARFYQPGSMVLDPTNPSDPIIYVADTSMAGTIRKIRPAAHSVTTLTFSTDMGAMTFRSPGGLALDAANQFLYVSEFSSHVVDRIDLNNMTVSTIAGTFGTQGSTDGSGTSARFNQPFGLAIDESQRLFVADYTGNLVRMITLSTNMVNTVAGNLDDEKDGTGLTAAFSRPAGLVYDGAGTLYVSDAGGQTIRKITQLIAEQGIVTTLAGTGGQRGSIDGNGVAARFNHPLFMARRGESLLIADALNGTIRSLDLTNGEVRTTVGNAAEPNLMSTGVGAAAHFKTVAGIVFDGTGRLYVSDQNGCTIRKVEHQSTVKVTTFASVVDPAGITWDGTDFFVVDRSDSSIKRISSTAVVTPFSSPGGGDLVGVVYAGGSFYATDQAADVVYKIDGTGHSEVYAGGVSGGADANGTNAQFDGPRQLAFDGLHYVYAIDTNNAKVRRIDINSADVTTIVGSIPGLYGIAYDASNGGTIYASSPAAHAIYKITNILPNSGIKTQVAGSLDSTDGSTDGIGTAARFNRPSGLAITNGQLYIADQFNYAVRTMDLTSLEVRTVAGSAEVSGSTDGIGALARFTAPKALVATANGEIFLSDASSNQAVRKLVELPSCVGSNDDHNCGACNFACEFTDGGAGHNCVNGTCQ